MAAFTPLDYIVFLIFLGWMVGLGFWARKQVRSTDDFLLANRKLKWPVLGVSFALFGAAAMFYCSTPNEAYWQGLKFLLVPMIVWATVPLVMWVIIPLYHNLELDSVYEYLELRYDPKTRKVVGMLYVFWQVFWLAGLLVLPCHAMQVGTGFRLPILLLVAGVGLVTLFYTFLGGMRASVWTAASQFGVIGVTLLVLLFALGSNAAGGFPGIWRVSKNLHRDVVFKDHPRVTSEFSTPGTWGAWTWGKMTAGSLSETQPDEKPEAEPADPNAAGGEGGDAEDAAEKKPEKPKKKRVRLGRRGNASDDAEDTKKVTLARSAPKKPTSLWTYKWSVVPTALFLALVSAFFVVGDQSTLQRWFCAEEGSDMRGSYLLGLGLFSVGVALAMYVGMGLLAVYQHEDTYALELRPNWVANSATDPTTGKSFIGPKTEITKENVVELAREKKILDPNTGRPYDNLDELTDENGELVIDRLITRDAHLYSGERWVRRGHNELLSQFVTRHLKFGLGGLFLAGLVGAAMAAVAAGLTGLTTLVIIDFHRRFGWAEQWLSERCEKPKESLDTTDEMHLARPVLWGLGVAVLIVAVLIGMLGQPLAFLIGLLGIFAGPMLAVFLLGIFTKRTTGPGALVGLSFGMAVAAAITFWPSEKPFGPFWPISFGTATSMVFGYVFSFPLGERKHTRELKGLVVGNGVLGILVDEDDKPIHAPTIAPPTPQPAEAAPQVFPQMEPEGVPAAPAVPGRMEPEGVPAAPAVPGQMEPEGVPEAPPVPGRMEPEGVPEAPPVPGRMEPEGVPEAPPPPGADQPQNAPPPLPRGEKPVRRPPPPPGSQPPQGLR